MSLDSEAKVRHPSILVDQGSLLFT